MKLTEASRARAIFVDWKSEKDLHLKRIDLVIVSASTNQSKMNTSYTLLKKDCGDLPKVGKYLIDTLRMAGYIVVPVPVKDVGVILNISWEE